MTSTQWRFALTVERAGAPVPFLDLWPGGRSWALVLTHDVETDAGQRDMNLLRGLDRERGYQSSWNFVRCATASMITWSARFRPRWRSVYTACGMTGAISVPSG